MPPTFTELGVPEPIADVLTRAGKPTPFPIQERTVAESLSGRDLCGRAPTGSGKTLAFAVPVAALARRGSAKKPTALILVPTRELATQVAGEITPLADVRNLTVATFFGGTSIPRDVRAAKSVDIAVACPGRLADLVQRKAIDLSDVSLVVLDEADRLADMGFLPEVKRLLDRTRRDRQTLLFSATLDGEVDVLVRRYQRDPVTVELGRRAEDTGVVHHRFWHTQPASRLRVTADVIQAASPAIIFTRTKHGADRVARQLAKAGVTAAPIHGNRSQGQRERALGDFHAGRVQALVATDVAARGIHIDDVAVVVHFDPAGTDKDYTHRSGRTGRAGADGVVITLVTPDKADDVRTLQRKLGSNQQTASIDMSILTTAAAAPARRSSGGDGQRRSNSARDGQRSASPSGNRNRNRNRRDNGNRHDNGTSRRSDPRAGGPTRRNRGDGVPDVDPRPRSGDRWHTDGQQRRRSGGGADEGSRRTDGSPRGTGGADDARSGGAAASSDGTEQQRSRSRRNGRRRNRRPAGSSGAGHGR